MAGRADQEMAQFKLRIRQPLRAALEQAANRCGVSMNAEIARRLEATFTEERAFGGAEVARLVHMIGASFAHRGALAARASGRKDWQSDAWVQDPDCYREAMMAAVETILSAHPRISESEMPLLLEGLKSRILTRLANKEAEN